MLIDPSNADRVRNAYAEVDSAIVASDPGPDVTSALAVARNFLTAGRPFEVLRILRGLFEADGSQSSGNAGAITHRVA
jgi:flagellar biosynthesis repressor protein FlbT